MSKTAEENGIEVSAYLSPEDNVVVVHVDTPNIDEDEKGPLIRLYLNDDNVFENPPYPGVGTECKHVEDVVSVNDTAVRYGEVAWSFGDVTSLEAWNQDWTPDQAEEFLQQNGKALRDRLIAVGFEVMEDLLATWTPEEEADGEEAATEGTAESQTEG